MTRAAPGPDPASKRHNLTHGRLGAATLDSGPLSVLEFREVVKRVPDGRARRTVLDGVSFVLPEGTFAVLRGPSGAGKTTLLSLAGGLASPTSGEVLVRGEATSRLRDRARAELRRREVGYMFQDLQLIDRLTVLENVLLPIVPVGVRAGDRVHARKLLDRFGIGSHAEAPASRLSGGERQRAALARALVHSPSLLLLDEPTAHLDVENADLLLAELASLAKEGKGVLVASHDDRVLPHASLTLTLASGKLAS